MLGDKGFIAILGAVLTVIYTSIMVVVACVLCILGAWKLSQIIWKKARNKWNARLRSTTNS